MKNTNIITKTLLALISVIFFSCNSYLDKEPISDYTTGNFYETQSDFKSAVTGIYSILQTLNNEYVTSNLEGRSDNIKAIQTGHENDGYALCSNFTDDASTSSLNNIWYYYWKMIDRCNAVIDQIDGATFTDESYRNYYKGEAYFLRGYAYFQLGWMFGGVPLIGTQENPTQIKTTARSTQAETLDFAAKDLTQAAELLPETWSTSETGKATKYAAQGILARLYMFQKNYTAAKPLLKSIISSGLYQMATNYGGCFIDAYDNSPEHVFQIQYMSGNLNLGNQFVPYEVPETFRSTMFPTGGSLGMFVSEDLYNSYEDGDLRRDFTIQKGWTNSAGEYNSVNMFYIKYGHGTLPSVKTDYAVNLPVLRYTDVILMYAEVLNEEGYTVNGEAFSILNEVRTRAGLSALTSTQVIDQAAFRKAMLKERRVEFACEFLRWFDLLRIDNAMTVMNTFLARAEEGGGLYKMEEYREIFPIPQYELDINPNTQYMWQNPGY
jgi:starch-binding outer membrane protein, SusD/RagB family